MLFVQVRDVEDILRNDAFHKNAINGVDALQM